MAYILVNNKQDIPKIKRSKELIKEHRRLKTALYISLFVNLIQYFFF